MTSAQLDELTKDYPADSKERAIEFNDIINNLCDNGIHSVLYGLDTEFKTLMAEIGGMDRVKRGMTSELPKNSGLKQWGMTGWFGDYGQLGCCLKGEERAKMKRINARMKALLVDRMQRFDQECQNDPAFAEICDLVKANFTGLRFKFTDKSGNTRAVQLRGGGDIKADTRMLKLMAEECGDDSGQLLFDHYKHAFKVFSTHIVAIIGSDGPQAAYTTMVHATIYAGAKMPPASEDVPCLTDPAVPAAADPNISSPARDVSGDDPGTRGDHRFVREPKSRHHRSLPARVRIQARNSWRRIIRHEQSRKRKVANLDKRIAEEVRLIKDPATEEQVRSVSWQVLPFLAQDRREAVAKLWQTRLGEAAKLVLILPIILIGIVLVALLLASARSDKRN